MLYFQNKLEKKRAHIFESKNVHPKFKSTEKNSDKYPGNLQYHLRYNY